MDDEGGEVLYENTGASRYFMKSFSKDIMEYTKPEDFQESDWFEVDEDRGFARRHRVYKRLIFHELFFRKNPAGRKSWKNSISMSWRKIFRTIITYVKINHITIVKIIGSSSDQTYISARNTNIVELSWIWILVTPLIIQNQSTNLMFPKFAIIVQTTFQIPISPTISRFLKIQLAFFTEFSEE